MFNSKYVFLILAMVVLLGMMLIPAANAAAPAGYTLVWADECNGNANTPPDSTKWNLVNSGGGFGNAELQYYTNRLANSYYDGNGNLVIKAMKEAYSGYNYTSAKLFSQNKGDWKYCFIEIRAQLTRGRSIWPAFWMMPTNSVYGGWPVSGEIDIMENRGDQTNKIGGTIHFGNPWKYLPGDYFLPSGQVFYNSFHNFQIEWEPTYFKWYVDNNLYHTRYQNEWYSSGANEGTNPYAPFDQNFYLQLNLAIGGPNTPYTGYQTPDDSVLPQYLIIDYVRVYQKGSYPTPTPTSPPPPVNIPGQIEAENYSAMSGIDTESCSEGGLNVGWIETNDWMDYNVNVVSAGVYNAEYRVASTGTTGRFDLRRGSTVLGSYTVPNTGGWQAWTTVSGNVSLGAGTQLLRIVATGSSWNFNWLKFSPTATATPTPPPAGKSVPGQIEAESYDAMSGIQTETCSEGGQNVGWIEANDWMDYNVNVSATATYNAEFRVASTGATGRFDLRRGSTTLRSYTVPNTGGWQAWTTVSGNVSLNSGAQTLRIAATGSGWNINWLRFSTVTGPTATPAPTPTTPPGPTPTPGSTLASATWYLFNTNVSGVSPAGQILQTSKSGTTGWQPTRAITTTSAYWYSSAINGTYKAGTYTFYLWTNNPGSSSQVRVELFKVNSDGGGATLIASQTKEAGTSGGGNHATTYTFSGIGAVGFSNQRLMVKITKASGVNCTMAYNTNDFPTRLVTP